jgi:hypothetical protein
VAYYDALIAKWATLTPGTTVAKLAQLNALTVVGSVPTTLTVTGAQLLNCINWTEFAALTATQQSQLLALCAIPGALLGGSGNTAFMVDGMLLAFFTNHSGPTILALTALAQSAIQPWWQVSVANGGGGLTSPVTAPDLLAAGGLT